MKVEECKNCVHHMREVWTQTYFPANYHAVGFSHAHGFCIAYNQRCSFVKRCDRRTIKGVQDDV